MLREPLSPTDISERIAALDAYLEPRTRLMLLCMGITVFGMVASVVATFFMPLSSGAFIYLMAPATLTMAAGAFLTVATSIRETMKASLRPLPPENVAELEWLLENVPQADKLKAAIAMEPRSYVHGELRALQSAYAENQASVRQTAKSATSK
jgi:hypothetical protein